MKKMISLGFISLCALTLVACRGNDNTKNDATSKSSESESIAQIPIYDTPEKPKKPEKTKETKETKEISGDFVATANDAYFDGTTLKGNTYTIKITSRKVIQPGEVGNEYGSKPVIAFWYDTLVSPDYNNDPPIDPTFAWIGNFSAVQDNDPNMINKLDPGSLPDDAFLDTQLSKIKPGGTVSNAVAYELSDNETPVTLTAESFMAEYGKADFPVK